MNPAEMDAKTVEMLLKGLQAYKRMASADANPATVVAAIIEVVPVAGVDATTKGARPLMPPNPLAEVQALEPPLGKKNEVEKKKTRKASRKS
ncbi:hypothetical protein COCNU_scaffold015101G000010 [Cocos nucifera]|nr:hypothetical protein [Cocos nucifera]